ncbi:ribonuclease domain-containing protein [Lachnospiraceae bacterium 62-35]
MRNFRRKLSLWLLTILLVIGGMAGCTGSGEEAGETSAPIGMESIGARASEEEENASEADEITEYKIAGKSNTAEEKTETSKNAEETLICLESSSAGGTDSLVEQTSSDREETKAAEEHLDEDGIYTAKDEVALYIHIYNRLPNNYITKKEAQKLGWDNKKGNLHDVAPGKSIGGSRFGNYEKQLPEKDGRVYYECDLNYQGGYRGAERLIYSNDGLIFYTEDHYNSFQELYGSESP